jgi:hypothetical protein
MYKIFLSPPNLTSKISQKKNFLKMGTPYILTQKFPRKKFFKKVPLTYMTLKNFWKIFANIIMGPI